MMKKNKVCIITECPYVGVFRAIVELSKELKKIGVEISYILPEKHRNRYGENQASHEKILNKYGNVFNLPLRRKLVYLKRDIKKMELFLQNNDFDVLVSYTEYAGKICRIMYKAKLIKKLFHVPSCIGIRRKNNISRLVECFFEKRLSKYSTAYLACGSSEAYILNNKYNVPLKKIIFLPNLRSIEKNKKNKKYQYQFIYVGRMIKSKGVFDLLEALKIVGFLDKSIFVGDGKDLEKLKIMYPEVKFTGRVKPEKVLDLFCVSKFFVSNSIIEGLPYTLIEAMSVGVVPIVSNVEGHKDLVNNCQNGFLYDKKIDLVNCIFKSQLIGSKDYDRMSESAKITILNLNNIAKKNIKNCFEKI